ncbi:MAG: hypothetical protein PHN22_05135 [Candidatus ainarchaeum sp.]|nr:hypothetical protein [Candidatus ainarchaeum sp.]
MKLKNNILIIILFIIFIGVNLSANAVASIDYNVKTIKNCVDLNISLDSNSQRIDFEEYEFLNCDGNTETNFWNCNCNNEDFDIILRTKLLTVNDYVFNLDYIYENYSGGSSNFVRVYGTSEIETIKDSNSDYINYLNNFYDLEGIMGVSLNDLVVNLESVSKETYDIGVLDFLDQISDKLTSEQISYLRDLISNENIENLVINLTYNVYSVEHEGNIEYFTEIIVEVVSGNNNLININICHEIPKEVARDVSEVIFKNTPSVLNNDPVIK